MIDTLRAELIADPLGRGYAGMTALKPTADDHNVATKAIAASLNTVDRTRPRASMSGDEVYPVTDPAELAALDAGKQKLWMDFCARPRLDPGAYVSFVEMIFGADSKTLTAFNLARMERVSRATELGLERVEPGHVQDVLRLEAEAADPDYRRKAHERAAREAEEWKAAQAAKRAEVRRG